MSASLLPLLLLLTLTTAVTLTTAANITAILSHYPTLSSFSSLLTLTSLTTFPPPLTLLAVPNSHLTPPSFPSSSTSLSDLLRLHIIPRSLPPSPPYLLPSLLQSTGRAPSPFLNFTLNSVSTTTTPSSSATIMSKIILPNNLTILILDTLLELTELTSTSASLSSNSTPPIVNITQALTSSHGFNVFSSILIASGVIDDFQKDESGAGLTIFVPTDQAFADIPPKYNFQSLSSEEKAAVLRFHCIRSYYPLGSLLAIVNPLQPTLATETMGAGKFTLSVSGVTGKVVMDTGIVKSEVDQTVFDQNPVVIFGVPVVLLPKEIFGGSGSGQ